MKKVFYFVSLACMMMFAACSSDNDEFDNSDVKSEKITINVNMPGANDTRVAFDGSIENMVWKEGDALRISPNPTGYGFPMSDFSLTGGFNTASGKFTGTFNIPAGAKGYEVYYKGSNVTYMPQFGQKPQYKYDNQTQTALGDYSHIMNHTLLSSGIVSEEEVKSGKLMLAPKCAVLKINAKDVPASIKDASSVSVRFYLNEYKPEGNNVAKAIVNVAGPLTGTDNIIYMAFDPSSKLWNNKTIAFEFESAGVVCRAYAKSSKGKVYEAGKIYTVTIDNQTNTKNLHWEKTAVSSAIFNVTFNSDTSYSNWTCSSSNVQTSFLGGNWGLWLSNSSSKNVDEYFILSDELVLGKDNVISMEAANGGDANSYCFAIKEKGAKTWTPVAVNACSGSYNSFIETKSVDLSAYNDKTVQVAVLFKANKNISIYAHNFKVQGTK